MFISSGVFGENIQFFLYLLYLKKQLGATTTQFEWHQLTIYFFYLTKWFYSGTTIHMKSENMCIVAPSMLSADFAQAGKGISLIQESKADWVHLDVMDGSFVPNISFGPKFISDIRKETTLPFDTHLMVKNPDQFIQQFVDAGSDYITVHAETCTHLHRTINSIHQHGIKAGISIVPSTEVSTIDLMLEEIDLVLVMSVNPGFGGQKFIDFSLKKIKQLDTIRKERNLDFLISVDGGVTASNAQQILNCGADVLVVGTTFFHAKDQKEIVDLLHSLKRS
jgi:ribulose-phosphate 3-epimerase